MNDIFSGLTSVISGENIKALKTPCYVIDEKKLIFNGGILASVAARTGCKILLAQKAFSNYDFYPLLSDYLAGTEASGLYEARLGKEEMPSGEVHVFCAAYRDDEFDELLKYADHIVFNSVGQLRKFGSKAKACGKSIGLRNTYARGLQSSQSKPQGKFEDFGTLPTYILMENSPEVIEQKKKLLAEIRVEIQAAAEHETKNLQILRNVFNDIKASKDDLFCHKEFFKKSQEQVTDLFESTKTIINKIKEAHELIANQKTF